MTNSKVDSTSKRTLAKSLHTITALVQVGRYLQHRGTLLDPRDAVDEAAAILGYRFLEHDDPYFLKEKAAATLRAERPAVEPRDPVQYSVDNMSARVVALAGNAR